MINWVIGARPQFMSENYTLTRFACPTSENNKSLIEDMVHYECRRIEFVSTCGEYSVPSSYPKNMQQMVIKVIRKACNEGVKAC